MIVEPAKPGPPVTMNMLIGGEPVSGGQSIEVHNPARRYEVVGSTPRGTPSDVERAVAAAKRAQPAWASHGFEARAEAIARGLDRLEAQAALLAPLYTRENGKTVSAAGNEIAATVRRERNSIGYASRLASVRELPFAAGMSKVALRPFGVVAAIAPWNGPVVLGFTQIVSALIAGNAVVAKPPETCPLTLIQSLSTLAEELPAGVINIVTGGRRDVGDALVTHPDVDKIAFTGSIDAAREIISASGRTIKNLTLELGGNDPAVILDDAVFDEAMMNKLAGSVFRNCGQICLAVKRIYVPAPRERQFLEAFEAAAHRFVVGNGLEQGVHIGPVHSQSSVERVRQLKLDAVSRGATVKELGCYHPAAEREAGNFLLPQIVTNAPDDSRIVVEEQFAPIVPVMTYDCEDDAIARANGTVFGLGGSVWSADRDRAERLAWKLEAGTVWVNDHGTTFLNPQAPYGGIKQSGIGRKSGLEGVMEYCQLQTLTL